MHVEPDGGGSTGWVCVGGVRWEELNIVSTNGGARVWLRYRGICVVDVGWSRNAAGNLGCLGMGTGRLARQAASPHGLNLEVFKSRDVQPNFQATFTNNIITI